MREVLGDAEREVLVDPVAGSLLGGVRSPVLERAFDYWKRIDPGVGQRIEDKVRAGEGMGEGWGSQPVAAGRHGPAGAAITTSSERERGFWAHQDSNLEPKDYESSALTIEL